MSKGYIIGGGGSTKLYACIGVTYPSGSTCTCTNGAKTLKAKGTSGTAIFNVPSTGTWTVTATNGGKTASKSVSITAEGQTETVTLAHEYVLYNAGKQNVNFSNASVAAGNGYATVNFGSSSASMKCYNGTASGTFCVAAISSIAIDASPYTTLKMTYSISGPSGSGLSLSLSSNNSFSGYSALPNGAIASATKSATSDSGTLSVDLSKYTSKIGSVYCCVGLVCSSYEGTSTMTVSEIWLE